MSYPDLAQRWEELKAEVVESNPHLAQKWEEVKINLHNYRKTKIMMKEMIQMHGQEKDQMVKRLTNMRNDQEMLIKIVLNLLHKGKKEESDAKLLLSLLERKTGMFKKFKANPPVLVKDCPIKKPDEGSSSGEAGM